MCYPSWDLRCVDLVDPHTAQCLCPLYPLDKAENARGERRAFAQPDSPPPAPSPVAPLLERHLADHGANALPPGYIPHDPEENDP